MSRKVLGLHYFNPAVLMKLVEVIRGEKTSDETMQIGVDFEIETIAEEAEYQGVRIWFPAKKDTMSLNMQIDIGFGDVVYPEPEKLKFPPCWNFPHRGCCVTVVRV